MLIHTKPIAEITWADIEALSADGVEEGQTLEFKNGRLWDPKEKKSKPRDETAEAVVSFANAYGGTIIIGVDEDPETSACKLNPDALIREIKQRASSLEDAVRDIIDPKLAGLQFETVLHPTEADAGVLIIRVPQSLAAPHGFLRPAKGFIRRGRSSEGMTMRDLQSVFWEARTRRERVEAIRADHRNSFNELAGEKALRSRGRSSQSAKTGFSAPGAVLRISAIFQSPLSVPQLDMHALSQEIRPQIRSLADRPLGAAISDGPMRLMPVAHGYFAREPTTSGEHRRQFEWNIMDDGTISVTGWHVDRVLEWDDMKLTQVHLHFPTVYALSALLIISMARRISKKTIDPDQSFEIDLQMYIDPNAFGADANDDTSQPQKQRFEIGPFVVSDHLSALQAFKGLEREVWRAFGFEQPSPTVPLRADLQL